MNLRKENDRLVYTGDVNEKLSWGWVQFPWLYKMRDGNIGLYIHDAADSWAIFDGGEATGKWLVSEDKGATWRTATPEDRAMMGTQLPNGDVLRSMPNPSMDITNVKESPSTFGNYHIPTDDLSPKKPECDDMLPNPITYCCNIFGDISKVYMLDSIPDKLCDKRFSFYRLKNGESRGNITYSDVDWKYRTTVSFKPNRNGNDVWLYGAGLASCRTPIVAPDGSLYIAHYRENGTNPFTGVYEGTTNAYFLRSTDNGESWQIVGYIPYKEPDTEKDPLAYLKKGFDEPTIAFMPDGSVLCLLRTCDVFLGSPEWGPTYITRSFDGCRTWTKPEYFTDRGALPQLLQLKNGVTLAVITRPGIYVYASEDNGRTWNAVVEVMTDKDRSVLANNPPEKPNFHQWAGSCCNCTILPLDDNSAILAYSDFYVECEDGIKRKGIRTVEIHTK